MTPPHDRKRIPKKFLDADGVIDVPVATTATPTVELGPRTTRRLVVGCMTGTSLDGLDAALVSIEGHGLALRPTLVATHSAELGALAEPLRALAEQQPMSAGAIARLGQDFSALHVAAIRALLVDRHADLLSIHGQTVYHAPPLSWQLLHPTPIAQALKTPVVCDLRAADLAAGGQGAPLTPLADLVLFGHQRERRVIANLGGFCNLTRMGPGRDPARVSGYDLCACNQVLDGIARSVLGQAYDDGGDIAQVGKVRPAPFKTLVALLTSQSISRRSLGTGDELQTWLGRTHKVPPADLARTACAAVAQVIVTAAAGTDRLVLAGGGVRNRALVAEIKERATFPVQISDSLGVPAAYREAMAWAVLGALCQDRVPVTLPQVTGVTVAPIAGMWVLP